MRPSWSFDLSPNLTASIRRTTIVLRSRGSFFDSQTIKMSSERENFSWDSYDRMSDRRTKGWFLVDSAKDVAFVVALYLLMVYMGPKFMKKKKPFQINGLLIAYNFVMMLVNFLILKNLFLGSVRLNYKYLCHRSTLESHPEEIRVMKAMWWFYISKALDFTDTLFFILRKKNNQLSLLHVYHHSTMFPICWSSIKWYPSGAAVRLPMLNSFVHVIMYFYYGLSAIGPSVKKMLWWKRYLTVLQLIQFAISLCWSVQSLVKGCNHPVWIDVTNIVYMCSFLFLFGRFYVYSYLRNGKLKFQSQGKFRKLNK